MEHLSPHGLVFVALQALIVLALHWALHRWHDDPAGKARIEPGKTDESGSRRRFFHAVPLLFGLGFIAWTVVLRVQPSRQGGDPFAYTLGIFDGVSLAGITTLVLAHLLLHRRQRSSHAAA